MEKETTLYNPQDLRLTSDGYGEFPDGYTLTDRGMKNLEEFIENRTGKKYTETDIMNALHSVELKDNKNYSKIYEGMKEWFEQSKNK